MNECDTAAIYREGIIERLKNGDHRVMAVLMEMYKKNLNCLASRFVENDGHAKDIVAFAFIKVWQKREFESLNKIQDFLYVIVKNECTNYQLLVRRGAYLHGEIAYLMKESEEYIEGRLIKSVIYQLELDEIENLPPARRQIFKMIYLDDLSTFEVAKQPNISEDTVRVQKARALNSLRSRIVKKGITFLN